MSANFSLTFVYNGIIIPVVIVKLEQQPGCCPDKIKKWLYSDHDIFYRELISNGCDAITKLKKLALMGEYEEPEDPDYKITVTVNQKERTIVVEDNGMGMTAEEVDEYINQIAFSGAQDFLNKYKDKANEDQIIGHFGLGFYSAFMVADKVTIDTQSYQADAAPVHWESEGGTEFEMRDGDKEGIGTRITLYLNEDSAEFSNEYRAREVIEKYCGFMPFPIYLVNADAEPQYETIEKDELTDKDTVVETVVEEEKTEEKEKEDGTKETVVVSPRKEKYKILKRPVPLNDTNPLWNKHPNECTEEEYKAFYRKVFISLQPEGHSVLPEDQHGVRQPGRHHQAVQQSGVYRGQHQRGDSRVSAAVKGRHRLPGSAAERVQKRPAERWICKEDFRLHQQEGGGQAVRHVQDRAGDL